MRGSRINKWKLFERLVAAIHLIDESSSNIKWNDKINARQFDVTIRTRKGFYDYLTVVECKNYSKPVPVKEVDAFVTKSQDVGAHKVIMVSSMGFQSGAEDVAKRHAIDLFTLKAVTEIPPEFNTGEIGYALNIYDIKLRFPDRKKKNTLVLPEDRNMLPYLVKHTTFTKEGTVTSLKSIIENVRGKLSADAKKAPQIFHIPFPSGTIVNTPVLGRKCTVSLLSFKYELIPSKLLKGDVALDPSFVDVVFEKYYYENIITNEQFAIPNKDVKIGFDTILEEGKFYEDLSLEFYYYCEHLEGDLATFFLVESYQHGDLIQVRFPQKVGHAKHYVEITDKKEIARLKRMYLDTIRRNPPQPRL